MSWLKSIRPLGQSKWAIGFVHGGLPSIMDGVSQNEDCRLKIDWVKMPDDRWYADPFVLDVTDEEILLLVEDYAYEIRKGVISLLHIDRASMEITSRKVLLEKPWHLSFPAIWRKNGHIYVSPESAGNGMLDLYEYHPEKEELTFVQTICDDAVWDSYISDAFGEPLLFTQAHEDERLDVYRWDDTKKRFIPYVHYMSDKPNSRLAGAVFEYKGEMYYPAQDCSVNYGGAIDIKRIIVEGGKWKVERVKHLESPHPKYQLGMHTMNEYKGVVVIDVRGYRFGKIGEYINEIKKYLRHK